MFTSRALIPSLLLSTALVMGGCKAKDKTETGKTAAGIMAAASADKASARDFEKMLKVEKRSVTSADAEKALSEMGLTEGGDSAFKWNKQDGKDGNYVYTNLSAAGDDGEDIKIEELKLTGVHMDGDLATFDRMDIRGLNVSEEDKTATVDRISIARPSPKLGAAILNAIDNIDGLDDLDFDVDLDEGEVAIGAFLIDGVKVRSDDANMDLKSAGWGEDQKTGKGTFLIDDFSATAQNDDKGYPVKMSLGSLSGTGLDMDYMRNMSKVAGGMSSGANPLASLQMNPFKKVFEAVSMKDLDIAADTLSITSDGFAGTASEKGDVTTIKQSFSPIKIAFTGDPTDRGLIKMRETLQSVGLEEIAVSMASTTVIDKKADSLELTDSSLTMKDAFDLKYAYKASGISALAELDDSSDPAAMMEKMSLNSFNMALTDNSIVEKVLAFAAEQQGTTPNLMKMQAKSGLMMIGLAAQNEAQGKALTSLGSALGKFLDEGGTLKVALNPVQPIDMASLKGLQPQSINPDDFGFSVQHTK